MSTLIYSSNGHHCTGKCDANCYNATSSPCNCICGGKNHGVGMRQAMNNTAELADEWIEKWKQTHGEKENVQVGKSMRPLMDLFSETPVK